MTFGWPGCPLSKADSDLEPVEELVTPLEAFWSFTKSVSSTTNVLFRE